jgi:hypothetical protein
LKATTGVLSLKRTIFFGSLFGAAFFLVAFFFFFFLPSGMRKGGGE